MDSNEFKRWREHMQQSQQGAADMLGLSKASIELYERGTRRDDDRPVTIPKTVELACAALAHGITTYIAPRKYPPGTFRVVQIELGAYGEHVSRTDIGPPFATRPEAESFARNKARAFSANGENDEHGYWWGRSLAGKVHRFVVASG
jgi:DNA-binding XRE family transcriptional regulator